MKSEKQEILDAIREPKYRNARLRGSVFLQVTRWIAIITLVADGLVVIGVSLSALFGWNLTSSLGLEKPSSIPQRQTAGLLSSLLPFGRDGWLSDYCTLTVDHNA